jgi:hypothetical protein
MHKWSASDGSELVPTTDIKINLTYIRDDTLQVTVMQ